jgi:ubiquinol-cytochrome c reductase cytochrome b subunit
MNQEKSKSSIPFLLLPLLGIFALTFFSGLFLSVYYAPTFTQAFSSLERLNEQVPFGWLIRRLHGAGGNLFLILIFISLLQTLYKGNYKIDPRSFWVMGVLLFFMAVLTHLTGFLLPLSQSAFWGMVTVLSSLSTLPWFGNLLVELLRGGKEIGGGALIRFYSIHIGISAVMAFILLARYKRFFTERETEVRRSLNISHFLITMGMLGLLLFVITFAPHWVSDPLKEMANPIVNPERLSPPWYFLFFEEALKFLTGAYPFWSGIAFLFCIALLFFLPFIDRNPQQNLLLRPMILALGSASLMVLIYFSLVGTANARYGEKVILPAGPLSPPEIRGAQVFAQKNCAYCHQVFGREGRREGPDMSVVRERKRSADWIRRHIFNARLYQPGTTMPRYEIPLEDLEALSAYLLSLDVKKGKFKMIERKELIDFGPYLVDSSSKGK